MQVGRLNAEAHVKRLDKELYLSNNNKRRRRKKKEAHEKIKLNIQRVFLSYEKYKS